MQELVQTGANVRAQTTANTPGRNNRSSPSNNPTSLPQATLFPCSFRPNGFTRQKMLNHGLPVRAKEIFSDLSRNSWFSCISGRQLSCLRLCACLLGTALIRERPIALDLSLGTLSQCRSETAARESLESETCDLTRCEGPTPPALWGPWGACAASCGDAERSRQRVCPGSRG